MDKIRTHRDLDVWKASMELAEQIYNYTDKLPKHEQYGLSNQIRRAVVSIVSNIAEGAARQSSKEFIQFLYFALGSAAEVETQIELIKRLGYLRDEELRQAIELRERVSQMLYGLIRKLKRQQ